jgi:hypothetical protein
MFVYSVRASGIRFFAIIGLAIALLFGILAVNSAEASLATSVLGDIKYDKIKSANDAVDFLLQFGIEVDSATAKEEEITLGGEFDRVMLSYNEIQKRQGLDLSKYKNKRLTLYTFKVTNFKQGGEGENNVHANVFVFRNRVVAGDVSQEGENGFVITFSEFLK